MMIRKSDIVIEAFRNQDWKKALRIAKDFRKGITKEEKDRMERAYECIVHPGFYKQIGVDLEEEIEKGKSVLEKYVQGRC